MHASTSDTPAMQRHVLFFQLELLALNSNIVTLVDERRVTVTDPIDADAVETRITLRCGYSISHSKFLLTASSEIVGPLTILLSATGLRGYRASVWVSAAGGTSSIYDVMDFLRTPYDVIRTVLFRFPLESVNRETFVFLFWVSSRARI